MNKREKFLKEIAEVINRNSMEAYFNDTPDYILAKVAVVAMENFAEASARKELARLEKAIADMKARPEYYEQFNSPNGWGTYKIFVLWLEKYLALAKSTRRG